MNTIINLNSNEAFDLIYGEHYGYNESHLEQGDYPIINDAEEDDFMAYQRQIEAEFAEAYPNLNRKLADKTAKYLGDWTDLVYRDCPSFVKYVQDQRVALKRDSKIDYFMDDEDCPF